MQLTSAIHTLTIPFVVPTPAGPLPRSVNVFIVCGERVTLIDSGVAGAEARVFAYLQGIGREPDEIGQLLLSHAHPDHIGAASAVKAATGCRVAVHGAERGWIEDVERQQRERPVPGFQALVGGSVTVERELADGDLLGTGEGPALEVLATPGHSAGSVSFWCPAEGALVTGDAVPVPGDLPIFDDFAASVASLERLRSCGAEWLLSSWDDPRRSPEVGKRLDAALAWLARIRAEVHAAAGSAPVPEPMELCRRVVAGLGLSPLAVNPLVARSFMACLER